AGGEGAGLGAWGGEAREAAARLHLGARIDRKNGVDRQQIAGVAAAAELEDLAVLALDHEGGPEILLIARRAGAPVGDHALGDAGRLVDRFRHRLTLDQVLEPDGAFHLGENRPGIRIPLAHALATRDLVALVDPDARAVL